MYRIIYSKNSEESLKTFIKSYKKASLKLFYDTGIQDEFLILDNYHRAGDSLYQGIRENNIRVLSQEQVLGRKEKPHFLEIQSNFGNFYILLQFSENRETQTRYIENIIFTKK